MTSPEFTPSDNNVIRGIHTDIVLNSADQIRHWVSKTDGTETLYEMPPFHLPYPVTDAHVDFSRTEGDDVTFTSKLKFTASSVIGQNISNWERHLAKQLKRLFADGDTQIYRLQHQGNDFYLKLNDVSAVQVHFDSDISDCIVELSTVPLINLTHASEGRYRFESNPDHGLPVDHVEALRSFMRIWSVVVDSITDRFGEVDLDATPRSQIVIAPPLAHTAGNKETFSNPKNIELRRPLEPPSIEMAVLDEGGMDMVGGLTQAKIRLRELADIFEDQVGAHMYGLSARHFVLHGPPGTGKTSLVKAFASELNATLWLIDSTSFISTWVGESGRNTRDVFETIKSRPGSERIVVFIQEFEAIATAGALGTQDRVDMKKQLNLAVDDITENHKNIIIVADTNADIASLEPSLVRSGRIEPIAAPLPNEDERVDVWAAVLTESIRFFGGMENLEEKLLYGEINPQDFMPYHDDIDPVQLARITDGMTGADFVTLLTNARSEKFNYYRKTGVIGKVSQADLVNQIRLFGR